VKKGFEDDDYDDDDDQLSSSYSALRTRWFKGTERQSSWSEHSCSLDELPDKDDPVQTITGVDKDDPAVSIINIIIIVNTNYNAILEGEERSAMLFCLQ